MDLIIDPNAPLVPFAKGMTLLNANGAVSDQSLGYQYTIQTTAQIRAKVIDQVFYELPIEKFVPIEVGMGAFMEDIKTNVEYSVSGSFESGIQGVASGPTQIMNVNVATAPKTAHLISWMGGYQYNVMEVEKALASNNWSIIEGSMKALKKRWDLGVQKIAFLGLKNDNTRVPGLLNNPEVTVDSAILTGYIKTLNAADFASFIQDLMGAYFANSGSTVLPDTLAIPMVDYLGLTTLTPGTVGTYPVSKLSILLQAFREATQNPGFSIHGVAYCDQVNNAGYIGAGGSNRYVLYRKNPETVKMDMPVPLILHPANTSNNVHFNGVGMGQFGGCIVYRVPEFYYFGFAV